MRRVRVKAMSCSHGHDQALAYATTLRGQPIGRLKEVRRRDALVQGGEARCGRAGANRPPHAGRQMAPG
ncbi:hypothetical protein BO443_10023 [Burkholderia orbicola]